MCAKYSTCHSDEKVFEVLLPQNAPGVVFGSPKKPDQKAGPKHLPPSFKHRRTPVEKDRVPSRKSRQVPSSCAVFYRKFAILFPTRKDPARIKQTKFKFNSCKQKECCKLYSQEKIHGIPTTGLGRELSYWSWKNWGVSFKSQTKELCAGSSWPRFAADLQLFCVVFGMTMMSYDDHWWSDVTLCESM